MLIINKPSGMTSHDVVDTIRRITGERTVGHAGTLDPLATGVLVIGIGKDATRTLGSISKDTEKRYRATIRFGATSETDDAEGMIQERDDVRPFKKSDLLIALKQFTGSIQQIPPAYSSVKVGGVKSYDRARKGEAFTLAPRSITIHSIHIETFHWPEAVLDVTCSSGTYIRSLAHDLGEALGTGAYLAGLVRTAVGLYMLQQAVPLASVDGQWQQRLLPIPQHP